MITREWHRIHKDRSRENLDEWLNRYATANFEAGIAFAAMFISRVLKEKRIVTDDDIKALKFHEKQSGDAESRHISPMEYKDKTDSKRVYDKFK